MKAYLLGTPLDFDRAFDWIIEFSLCGTILMLGVMLVSLLAKRQRASLRHAIWTACMISLVAIPVTLTLPPRLEIQLHRFIPTPVVDEIAEQAAVPIVGFHRSSEQDSLAVAATPNERVISLNDLDVETNLSTRNEFAAPLVIERSNVALPRNSRSASAVAFMLWCTGALACLFRLGFSCIWLRRLLHCSSPATGLSIERETQALAARIGLSETVRLRIGSPGLMPMVVGTIRPVLLIPESVLEREPGDRRAIVLHELGHIARRDPLSHFLSELAGVFFWFHPLYWFARRRSWALREQACDDLVLRHSTCPAVYARCLVSVAASHAATRALPVTGIAMSTRRIEKRLRAILSDSSDRRPLSGRLRAVLLFTSFAFLFPIVMIRAATPDPQQTAQQQTATTQPDRAASDVTSAPEVPTDSKVTDAEPINEVDQADNSETVVDAEKDAKKDALNSHVVSGTVVDPSGMPIENARVLSRIWNSKDKSQIRLGVRSDADGRFTLTFPDSHLSEYEDYPLWIWAEGHQLQATRLSSLFFKTFHVRDVKVELPKAEPIRFRILKPDGQPCAKARLIPGHLATFQGVVIDGKFAIDETRSLHYSVSGYEELVEILEATSDKDGNVQLTNIPPNLFDRVDVISDEFGTQRFGFRPESRELRLVEVGEIRGRVQIDEPSQIAGTKLSLSTRHTGEGGPFEARAEVQLDENGRFHVPALAATNDSLFVWAYNWNEELDVHPFLDRRITRERHAGEVLELVIKTVPTVLVHGRVLTADTREPVVGATAVLNCLSSPINGVRDLTDQDGRFSLRIAPGRTLQQVTTMGTDKSLNQRYDYPRLDRIEIPGNVEEFELEPFLLTPKQIVRGSVRGHVRDTGGDPVANATLVFHYRENGRIVSRTVTDDQGKFSVAVRDWHLLQSKPSLAARYRWSILESESEIENGYQKRDLTPLNVVNNDANAMALVRP